MSRFLLFFLLSGSAMGALASQPQQVQGEDRQTAAEPLLETDLNSQQPIAISRLRVRPPESLTQQRLALFYCLWTQAKGALRSTEGRELLAFIVEDELEAWSLQLAPNKGSDRRESYSGLIPVGAVGVVHTHGWDDEVRPGPADWDTPGIRRNMEGSLERIHWNYFINSRGIGVVDSRRNFSQVLGAKWHAGQSATDCEGKITDVERPRQ